MNKEKIQEANDTIENKAINKIYIALYIIFLLVLILILIVYGVLKPKFNSYVEKEVQKKKEKYLEEKKEIQESENIESTVKKIENIEGIKLQKLLEKFNIDIKEDKTQSKNELINKLRNKEINQKEIQNEINILNKRYGDNLNYPKFNKEDLGTDILYSKEKESYYINNHLMVKGNNNFKLEDFQKILKTVGADIISGDEKENIYIIKFNRTLNEKYLLDNVSILEKNKNVENSIIIYLTNEEYKEIISKNK